jgi:nucleoid-associated protein YgaU
MLRGGIRGGWPRLGVLLITLGLGVEAQAAQDLGAGTPDLSPGEEPCAGLRSRVEQLTQHIQGIEDKLRESAAARKSADQARMEAERRLAAGTQDLARLKAEVILLEDAKLALEARLERSSGQAQIADQALHPAGQTGPRPAADGDAQGPESYAAEDRTAPRRQANEVNREQLRRLREQQLDLRRTLSEREADLKRVQADLRAVRAERDALNRRLETLSLPGPTSDGGATTLEEAQTRAGTAAASLLEAMAHLREGSDPEARRALWDASQELRRWQLRAALLSGARSVYRVGPGDSLDLIASRFYGDGRRWLEIQAANRLVIPDPSQLIPGMTLLIP